MCRPGDRAARLSDQPELAALAGVLEGLVFTAGIGEHARDMRARVCCHAAWLGIELDPGGQPGGWAADRERGEQGVGLVVPTDKERMIARHTLALLNRGHRPTEAT